MNHSLIPILIPNGRVPRRGSVLALLLAFLLTTAARAQDEERQDGRQVVRQGGYVEYVDPKVDYKARVPRIPPREPAASLAGMDIVDGFRLELVASEPLIRDAVDIAFDERGRLFVVEMSTYPEAGETLGGRVSRLEDVDGDGRFESGTVFASGLMWPTGVVCYGGGIFVASAPDILWFEDVDGDGRADRREVVISGFDTTNPNAFPNSLRWGLDGWIHGMSSTAGGVLHAVRWGRDDERRADEGVQCRGRDFRFHPRTGELQLESGGSQFGMSYDDWGRKFESSNSAPIQMVMYEDRYIARNPHLVAPSPLVTIYAGPNRVFRRSAVEPWRVIRTEMRIAGSFSGPVEGGGTPAGYFTAACGVTVYTGDAWPEEYRGGAFVCEGAGNLVHRMRLVPAGIGFRAHRTEKDREFLASDEVWFRPIQMAGGPDGCLYIADMYREVFEHPDAVPPSVKKYLDLNAGNDRGRVYRVESKTGRLPGRSFPVGVSTAELIGFLGHPNAWHRRTASRLLYQRADAAAVPALAALATATEPPLTRLHALWALEAQGALTPDPVLACLDATEPRLREHAVRLSEALLAAEPRLREKLYATAQDEDARVRYQLAFTLGEIPGPRATDILAAIARRDGADPWVRLAVLSSIGGRSGELFERLAASGEWRASAPGQEFLELLAQQAGSAGRSDQVGAVLAAVRGLGNTEEPLAKRVVRGLGKGLERSGSPLRSQLAGGDTARILAALIDEAKALATRADAAPERRAEAIRTLALAPFAAVSSELTALLDGRQPREVQIAAVQALGRFRDDAVAGLLIEEWSGFSPAVRGEAIEALFARPDRLLAFLGAVEAGDIVAGEVDPVRIRLLQSHPDRGVSERAARIFGRAREGGREEVVESHRDVLRMAGDAKRGRELFRETCATCHKLEGVGHELGLPLSAVQNRGAEAILISILDPNREVNPQYLNYVAVTRSGQTATGLITAETATSVTLTRAEGATDTVLRADIEDLSNSGISIMPEALEEQLDKQGLADVLAYLLSLE